VINPLDRRVAVAGEPIELTVKEYELLVLLTRNPGRSFSRFFLLDTIWGQEYIGGERSVDTQIVRLRRKLGVVGDQIVTVWGVGYRFEERV
jgi:DNA-binding response OmpR family regulator